MVGVHTLFMTHVPASTRPNSTYLPCSLLALQVAARCNVYIPTGCLSGSCGICEVEIAKLDGSGSDSSPAVIRACIAKVPPGYTELQVRNMEDAIWGQDGFDT